MIAASGRTRHGLFGVLAALLPSEAPPDGPSWPLRHRAVMVVLGGHVAAVLAFAILVGLSGSNLLSDLVVVLVPAVVAALPRLSRPAWATFAAFGLMICCELLISDAGLAEDVDILLLLTVVIAALYRSWLPFLLTAGLVGLHNLMLLVSANAVGYQPGALADA